MPHRCSGPDFLDKDVDMPVVVPDRCSGPDVEKQFMDKDVDMPVVVLRQVLVSTCSKLRMAQLQFIDQSMVMTVETPQAQFLVGLELRAQVCG